MYSNRGSSRGRGSNRGSNRGGNRGGFRGGSRGGYRGSFRGNSNRNTAYSTSDAPQRARTGLVSGRVSPKNIFDYFNPSAKDYNRGLLGTINAREEKPDGVAYSLIFVENQPQWMSENIIYIKSRLTLLPEYADNKATLLKQHKEPSHEEVMERLADKLTETIKFVQYGLEDGPDMELFNQDDSISSMIVPGDWMPKAAKIHELPRIAAVDTPSVKYRPGAHDLIAVFAGYGDTSDVTGFKFIAWFLAEEIELFAAGSRDLARKMHDKKWDADFNREWAAVKLRRVERGTPEWRPYPDIRGRNKPQGAEEKAAEAAKSEEVGTRGDEGASQPGEATGSANEVDAQEPAERDETKVEGRKEEGVMDKEATAEMEGDETKEVGEVVGGGETMAATVEDAKVEVKREESKGAEEAAEGCEAKAAQMEEAKVEIKAEEPKEPRNAAEGGKVKDTQVETAKELKEEFKGQVEKDAEALAEEEEMREQAIRDEEDKLVEAKGQA